MKELTNIFYIEDASGGTVLLKGENTLLDKLKKDPALRKKG